MPRPAKTVKLKSTLLGHSPGAVDLHFHGAFGIDLMVASEKELNQLSLALWKNGIAAFCPTTLSARPKELIGAVTRLGTWISSRTAAGAQPIGIHLEGPFLSPKACGAHHPSVIRQLNFTELDRLWSASQETIKILTIAPETLTSAELTRLKKWAGSKKIRLSLGHSRCSEKQALKAFQNGFSGVTHAWNALAYHHRDSGAMGAAYALKQAKKNIPIIELIIDQIHVSPRWMEMTLGLFQKNLAFVSDCAPAAGLTTSRWVDFGNLKCRMEKGAARLTDGTLAGGGTLLTHAFARWLQTQWLQTQELNTQFLITSSPNLEYKTLTRLWKEQISSLHSIPLKALGFSSKNLPKNLLEWRLNAAHQVSFAWKKHSD